MAELLHDESFVVSTRKGMDYGKALTWYFSDPKFWMTALKFTLLLLSCIFILPMFYVGPVLVGYMNQIARNVQKGLYVLPELGEGEQWKEGVIFMLASIAISFVFVFFYMLLFVPVMFGLTALENESAGMILYLVFMGVQFIMTLLFAAVTYSMWIVYIKTQSVRAMFTIENISYVLKTNWVAFIISFLIYYAATYAFTFVGMLALCVGIFPAMLAAYIVLMTLLGQMDVDGVE